MEDVSKSYVDELGETNNQKLLRDNLLRLPFTSSPGFVMQMFASFVKLSVTSAAGELPGSPEF